jgi:hypothetical protein
LFSLLLFTALEQITKQIILLELGIDLQRNTTTSHEEFEEFF